MILYHASTVKIEEFYIPYGGLHIGGRHSALEAALRKVRGYNGTDVLEVFIHRLEVDTGRVMLYSDVGSDYNWRMAIQCYGDDCDSIEYYNKYEPDITNSYLIWDAMRVKILDVEVMSHDEAEDKLNEFYEENNLY